MLQFLSRCKISIRRIWEMLEFHILGLKHDVTSDDVYIRRRFFNTFGYELNTDNPKTFNEKINYLKLFGENKENSKLHQVCSDKVAARDYVAREIGSEHIIECYGVYDNPYQIDFDKLPSSFVLKASHASKMNIVVPDKSTLDIAEVISTCEDWLSVNHYYAGREWNYRDIPPQLIIEKMLKDEQGNVPADLKYYCFNGKVHFALLHVDGHGESESKRCFYDREWNKLPFKIDTLNYYEEDVLRPTQLEYMIELAEKLGKPFRFVRVDFYQVKEAVFFGELTFFPYSGNQRFDSDEVDLEIGKLLDL